MIQFLSVVFETTLFSQRNIRNFENFPDLRNDVPPVEGELLDSASLAVVDFDALVAVRYSTQSSPIGKYAHDRADSGKKIIYYKSSTHKNNG